MFAVLVLGCSVAKADADEYRAFWVDGWGAGFLNQSQVETLLGKVGDPNSKGTLRNANCNSVIVQVRRRFDVCYPSGVGEPYMSGLSPANFNALEAMIKAAHDTTGGKKRIEVHCWSVAFKTSKGTVYSQHSDTNNADNYWPTRIGSSTGAENGDGAFDPGHPKALEYLVNAHMDLVNFQTTAGPDGTDGHIDGIHYDYIRFEGNNEGFNPTSVARYNARYGLTGEPSSSNEQFKQWRRDQVSSFVRQMYARIQKTKPFVRQSGSFVTWNPSPTSSTRAAFMNTRPYYDVYSDWDSWMEEGIIDMSVPMTYYNWASLPSDYTRWMNFQKDRKFNRHMIIGPGTYLNSLSNAILELQMTRNASPAGNFAHGFSGYSYRVPYSGGTWAGISNSLATHVTTNWAEIPAMPWKLAPTNGHLMGAVTFAGSGAWADHATVSITGPVNRSMFVDGTGFYAFIDLPPGNYTVTASKAGFVDEQAIVNVSVGVVTGDMYEQNFVLSTNAAPAFSGQPQSQTVTVGQNATFTVTATGAAPLNYQWRFNGGNIGNATDSSYTRFNVQLSDAGDYSVVVTNLSGSAVSTNATLTVNIQATPPSITSHPQNLTVIAGQNASFEVAATGTSPLNYQWKFNGGDIANATDSTYTRLGAQSSHAGTYSVMVTNSAGAAPSDSATLTIDYTLTATATSGGSASRGPDQASYTSNDVVTVTAIPNANYFFSGWSGDASGTDNPLEVTMTSNKSVTANFASIADIILDNPDSAVTFTGDWQTGTGTGRYNSDYRFVSTTEGGASNVVYRPNIVTPGYYDVYIWYPQGSNRATNAPWSVFYEGGSTNIFVNQTTGGATWRLIAASKPFLQGTNSYVRLSNNAQLGKVVMADAVRFLYAGSILTPPSITSEPTSQTNNAGTTTIFSATATGSEPLSYQWKKDDNDLADGGNVSGATTRSLTLTSISQADAANYSLVVSNAAGTDTSLNAALTVIDPPIITTHPSSLSIGAGSNAVFFVTATGENLTYAWNKNNSLLSDGGNILGATTAILSVNSVTYTDTANYSVTVTNTAGSVTSSNASLLVQGTEFVPPTISFTSPAKTNAPIITLKGTAKDTVPGIVTEVWYRLHPETAFSPASISGKNWEAPNVTLTPGTNKFYAFAIDSSGNYSSTNSKTILYDTTSLLTVNIIGGGLVKNASGGIMSNGQQISLLVGRPSTLTAYIPPGTPATNYVFTNWSGTFTANTPTLGFTMVSNMVWTAQFISNPFLPVAGKYNGLFFSTNGVVSHQTDGFIAFNVTGKAACSGKILLDGNVVNFSGKFDLSGRASKTLLRSKFGKSSLTLDLALDWSTTSRKVFGTVGDGTWLSNIEADRAGFGPANPATNLVGRYTMLVPRANYPVAAPGGFGYGLITNSLEGKIVLSGKTGDGALLSQSVPMSKDGNWPLYVPLYRNTNTFTKTDYRGAMMGWVQFISSTNPPIGNDLSWIKTAVPMTDVFNTNYFYPAGFTNFVALITSPFSPPSTGTPLFPFTSATLTASHGNLGGPMMWNASIAANNAAAVSYLGGNKVALTLNAKTGLMKGTFQHPNNGNATTTFWGAVLQNQNYAAGKFTGRTDLNSTTNQTGSVILEGN